MITMARAAAVQDFVHFTQLRPQGCQASLDSSDTRNAVFCFGLHKAR